MIGPKASWILQPESVPCVNFRNICRYSESHLKKEFSSGEEMKSVALRQTKYFGECLSEHFVPSSLLYDHLLEDFNVKSQSISHNKNHSQLLCFYHDVEQLIVHTVGKSNNQLMLQSIDNLLNVTSNGFISDCFEESIREILLCSKASSWSENHLITM